MKALTIRVLVGLSFVAGLQAGCSDDDSHGRNAVSKAAPWLTEAEFDADPALHATENQVVVLDLEASFGSAPVLNETRQILSEPNELRLCIGDDEPYVTEVEIEEAATGLVVATAVPNADCTVVDLDAGGYRVRVKHHGSRVPAAGVKAFLHRRQGPELGSDAPDSFVVPDFMAFRDRPNGYFVTDENGAPFCLGPTTTTVDAHAVFRFHGGPSKFSLSNGMGAAVEVRNNCTLVGFLCTGDTGPTVVSTLEIHDQGNWQFTLQQTGAPCNTDLPIFSGSFLSYVNNSTQLPTVFTTAFKGYDCATACDADTLPLEQGEVALFAQCDFQGPAIVFRSDVRDFSIYDAAAAVGLAMGDNMVSSVRVGPKTLAYLYQDAKFAGASVAVGLDAACLEGTALGRGAASSMHINQIDVTELIVSTKKCENCIVPGIDLSGDDLSDGDFAGARFAGGDLTDTDFSDAILDRADLSADTNLTRTDFSGASLKCADFKTADLTSAIFDDEIHLTTDFSCRLNTSGSMLDATTIPVAFWRYLDLNEATIIHTGPTPLILSNAADPVDMSGALLNGVVGLAGAVFDGADMSCATPGQSSHNCTQLLDTDLNGASLRQTNLTNAAMNGARLIHANLERANLGGAQLLKSPSTLSSANLSGANLKNVNLADADLSGATLANANWHSSNSGLCNPATWTGTCASGQGATLSNADLSAAYLNGLDLTGATAQGAKLTGALLVGATFAGANLSGDPNTGASTNFAGAFLQGADFTDANTSGADFSSAYVDVTSTSGGFLVWQLPATNIEFTGYVPPPSPPECPLFQYSRPTRLQTISGNVCPDGNDGENDGRCSDAQWESPLTPIDDATPPVSADITMLPEHCTAINFNF